MESLHELLTAELRDLYDAEKQLVRALPKFAKAATDDELKHAFREHLEVTKGQVQRLERVFELLGQKPKSKPCAAMKGLLQEGQEILQEEGADAVLDSAMIGAAQKVEHYEISSYGTVRTLAEKLGMNEAAKLLQQTLTEEKEADERLTFIASRVLDQATLDDRGEEDDMGDEDFPDDQPDDMGEEEEKPKPAKKAPAKKK